MPGAMAAELELGTFVGPDGHVPVGQVADFRIQATQQVLSAQEQVSLEVHALFQFRKW